jgi:hypothetical protein
MNSPNKPRTHLFNPHTDQCIYRGKSAEDDAIENTPCGSDQPEPCEACGDKSWRLADIRVKILPDYGLAPGG